ncbi:MAG TPA: DnaD domain protein, partial [Acidobacteriota bacterium]
MTTFKGFIDKDDFTPIPNAFYQHLLGKIEDLDELKITIYALWRIQNLEGEEHSLDQTDFSKEGLGLTFEEISSGLEKAVQRGTLLSAGNQEQVRYFLNTPRGRAEAQAFAQGGKGSTVTAIPAASLLRPNIYKLYEENIGPITPLLADTLKDAEDEFDPEWIAEAVLIAVERNKRNWKYVEAILKRWKDEGRGKEQNRRDDSESRQRDVEEKFK